MASDVVVTWDPTAVKVWADTNPKVMAAVDRIAAEVVTAMKARCPVSPTQPTYAEPVPSGSSSGPAYRGRGLAHLSGPDVSRFRGPGDLPLRPSGYLRSSIRAYRLPDGSVIVGPTAPYGKFVNDGTPPHVIESTGPWPLRNRASGQVFGRVVHHPGTAPNPFITDSVKELSGVKLELG